MFDLISYILDAEGVEWLIAIPLLIVGPIAAASILMVIWKLITTLLNRAMATQSANNGAKFFMSSSSVETPEAPVTMDSPLEETPNEEFLGLDNDASPEEDIHPFLSSENENKEKGEETDFVAAMKCIASYGLTLEEIKREYIYQKIAIRNPYWQPWEQSWLLSVTTIHDDKDLDVAQSQYILALTNKITKDEIKQSYSPIWYRLIEILKEYNWYWERWWRRNPLDD